MLILSACFQSLLPGVHRLFSHATGIPASAPGAGAWTHRWVRLACDPRVPAHWGKWLRLAAMPLLYGRTDLTNRQLKKAFVSLGIGKSSKFGHSSFNRYVFYCSVGRLCQATERFSPKKSSLLYIFFYFILGIQLVLNNIIFIFLCFYLFVSSSGKCPYITNYLRKGLLQPFIRTKMLVYLYGCREIWKRVPCTISKVTS